MIHYKGLLVVLRCYVKGIWAFLDQLVHLKESYQEFAKPDFQGAGRIRTS